MNMTAQAEIYMSILSKHICELLSGPNYKSGHCSVSSKYLECYETPLSVSDCATGPSHDPVPSSSYF